MQAKARFNLLGLYSSAACGVNRWMSEFMHKSHNVTVQLYHLVFSEKYRRVVLVASVDKAIASICLAIEKRYEMKFLRNALM